MADHKLILDTTWEEEGGLSKNLQDNASRDPVPDGTGNHTNRGVTWATFKGLAAKLSYTATPALFYRMPIEIWRSIVKVGYWDVINLDNVKSQGLANLLFTIAWMSGNSRAARFAQEVANSFGANLSVDSKIGPLSTNAINILTSTQAKDGQFFERIFNKYMDFLKSLNDWRTFGNGWTNRLTTLYNNSIALIGKALLNPTKVGFWGLIITLSAVGMTVFF